MEKIVFDKLEELDYGVTEALRTLKTNIQFCGDDIKTILLTSSIPSEGFEIGDGFSVAESNGAANNDNFYVTEDGAIAKKTNHSGGTLGGMTDGSEIVFRTAFKPTPSIAQVQETVTTNMEEVEIEITGRHDPIIVPRAVVVVESMAAITILDALLLNMTARLDRICEFYNR